MAVRLQSYWHQFNIQHGEESGLCWRCCAPNCRKFHIHIVDSFGVEVITIRRPFRCSGPYCCAACDMCQQELEVWNKGIYLGRIKQKQSCCRVYFKVYNDQDNALYDITGPFCVWDCCCADDFVITRHNDTQPIGQIGKKWAGLLKELLTDADSFSVKFPMQLPAKSKALLLSATFLIDFMFYENNK